MKRLIYLLLILFCGCVKAGAGERVFHRFGASEGMSDNRVTYILQLPDGRMAIRTLGNVNIWDGYRFRYVHDEAGLEPYQLEKGNGCWRLMLAEDDLLWSQQWKNLRCFDLRHFRYIENVDSLLRSWGAKGRIDDLFVSSDRHTWVASQGRLSRLRSSFSLPLRKGSAVLRELDVVGDSLYLFYDDGEMHCHSLADGKRHYKLTLLTAGDKPEGENPNTRLYRAADGCLYMMYSYKNMAKVVAVNPQTRQARTVHTTRHTLHGVATLSDGSLITPNRVGYWQDSLMHQTIRLDDGDSIHRQILCHATTDREGNLWLASYFGGALMTPTAAKPFHSVPLSSTGIPQEWKDSLLVRLDTRDLFYLGIECNCHLTDSRGRTWIGTTDGLLLVEDGKRRMFYTEDGLSNNYIHAIVEDGKGRIWLTTSNGITKFDNSEFECYDESHGTLGGGYVNNGAMLLSGGDIVAWGVNGYTRFNPDAVKQESRAFLPVFIDFTLAGKKVEVGSPLLPVAEPYTDTLRLAYHQNNIALRFSAMNFRAPRQTRWRYRIKENERTWHEQDGTDGTLLLTFASMKPGTYTLQVQAYTGKMPQDADCKTLTIIVSPPWWQTAWAYTIYIIVSLLALVALVRLYILRMRRRMLQRQKEQLLMQRINDLMAQVELFEKEKENAVETAPEDDAPSETNAQPSLADAEFIRRAVALVEQHVGEREYSVNQLAADLCMERTGLYKKLSALVATSPTFFIRNIRLQRAAQLLQTTQLSMQEISERTGFSSPSYFTKCFKDEMGCLPSEYREKQ